MWRRIGGQWSDATCFPQEDLLKIHGLNVLILHPRKKFQFTSFKRWKEHHLNWQLKMKKKKNNNNMTSLSTSSRLGQKNLSSPESFIISHLLKATRLLPLMPIHKNPASFTQAIVFSLEALESNRQCRMEGNGRDLWQTRYSAYTTMRIPSTVIVLTFIHFMVELQEFSGLCSWSKTVERDPLPLKKHRWQL